MDDRAFDACLQFVRDLIAIPSLPMQEGDVARRVEAEMCTLGYDEVTIDAAGNVIGRIFGRDRTRAVLLNAHIDHVSVGEAESWPHPPFAAEIAEGRVWGRGSADLKGSVAVQVHAAALAAAERKPDVDVVVAAVVMEEVGGLGTLHLLEHGRFDLAIVGEPSHNELRNGNRGRFEFELVLTGRACHASAPEDGLNPNTALPAVLGAIFAFPTPEHDVFGRSSLTPTRIRTDQDSTNVVPSQVRIALDYRAAPGETPEAVQAALRAALSRDLPAGIAFELNEVVLDQRTWNGLERSLRRGMPGYYLPEEDASLRAAQAILSETYGRAVPIRPWRFTTDGGNIAAAGVTTLGFGPCEEGVIHTSRESVPLAMLREGLQGYVALLSQLRRLLPQPAEAGV